MSYLEILRSSIFYIRIPFALLGWFGVIGRHYWVELDSLKFFTVQTSTFVAIWLTLAIIYKDGLSGVNTEKVNQLYGLVKGGFTAYITLTFIGYLVLFAPTSTITGFEKLTSDINHYVCPVYFIFDWFITERKSYPLRYPLTWLIYPLGYTVFALIFQLITNDPIYQFLELDEVGYDGFFTMAAGIFVAFSIFCFIYFGLNKAVVKETVMS